MDFVSGLFLKEFNNPDLGFWKFFEKHPFPVPYFLETAGLNFLFLFVGPLIAQKIWVSLIVLLRPLAVFYMLRQLGRGREIYGLACLPMLYDYSLMRGYSNYFAGVSIGLIVLGYYVKHRNSWRPASSAIFCSLVLLHYFTHPVALAVTGLLLAAYEFAVTRSPRRIVGIVLRGYLPSLILLAAFFYWSSRHSVWIDAHLKFVTISDKIQNAFYRGGTPLSPAVNFSSLILMGAIALGGTVALLRRFGKFSFDSIYIHPKLLVKYL